MDDPPQEPAPSPDNARYQDEIILAEVVEPSSTDDGEQWHAEPVVRRRLVLPAVLFLMTCLSTVVVAWDIGKPWHVGLRQALLYAVPVMVILTCHELGHFIQTLRYRVYASLPYFIPVPLPPFGTLGAVIVMEPRIGNRRALFDIGISGPLAGLIPTVLCIYFGLQWSETVDLAQVRGRGGMELGEPLLFQLLTAWLKGPLPPEQTIYLHPVAFAGWVGLFLTSLNLFPIAQLDGSHILYGLLRRKAHVVSVGLLAAAVIAIGVGSVVFKEYLLLRWSLLILILILMRPCHPPTANDDVPLGLWRHVLGWLTLAFLPLGFTPFPFLQ
jgi:membrane-associated protease RseP (regulator of RpoE activity)